MPHTSPSSLPHDTAREAQPDAWVLRWGRPEPPAPGRALTAGPLELALLGADLLNVRMDGRQLLSRVGVKVRDTSWGTVPGELSDVHVDEGRDRFEVRLTSRHHAPGVSFEWECGASGRRDGTLVYEMRGTALKDCAFNRIGICLLHSAASSAGRPFTARGPNGPFTGRLPRLVGPQPMEGSTISPLFPGFSELEIDLGDDLVMRLELEGDTFEMEDQRNWTDGSFKTYSTPVGLPVPHHLAAGTSVIQRARVQVRGVPARAARTRSRRAAGTTVTLNGCSEGRMPPLGAELDTDGHEPTARELSLLRSLGLTHLRVSLSPSTARPQLRRARRVAGALGCRLELAVTVSLDSDDSGLADLASLVAGATDVDRLIVLQDGRRVTDPAAVTTLRELLGEAANLPLLLGTDMYFAELNRDRPAMDEVDGLAYPITPQVHDDDEAALVESLAAQADTVATARSFSAGKPVHVSPVTLKPRWNPFARQPGELPEGVLPPSVDPRQPSLFTAGWTIGSIRRLADAGAASVTYFELTGWRGLVERESGSLMPEAYRSHAGTAYPVLSVMREACGWVGAELLAVGLEDPLGVEALAVRRDEQTMLLVANLRPYAQRVTLSGLPSGPAATWKLDARDLDGLSAVGDLASPSRQRLVLELDAWSVARVLVQARA